MTEILAFFLVSFLGVFPVLVILMRILFKNALIFYLTSFFIFSSILIANSIYIFTLYESENWLEVIFFYTFIFVFLIFFIKKQFQNPVEKIIDYLNQIAKGTIQNETFSVKSFFKEIKKIADLLNQINLNLTQYHKMATDIENVDNQLLQSNDKIAQALVAMQDNYKKISAEEERRKKDDAIKNWQAEGTAGIIETLRHNNKDLFELSFEVLSDLTKYIEANVGGIFMIETNTQGEQFLELIASFAYDRRKFLKKEIPIKEGLIGACAREQKTILLTKVPTDYMSISTGLGGADPRAILLIPLKIDDQIIGVLELASFAGFKKHVVDFIESISENIASMLLNLKRQKEASLLIEKGKKLEEIISQKDEEMNIQYEEFLLLQDDVSNLEQEILQKNLLIEELKYKLQLTAKE